METPKLFDSQEQNVPEDVDELVRELRITKREFALALGLHPDSITRRARQRSLSTQRRLKETFVALKRVRPWAGSTSAAWSWCRAQPIPALGGLTAAELIGAGRGDEVQAFLDTIAEGGYA